MKINKKDILKKYVLPILIFGGIIFLATMKGSSIENMGGGEFNEENCIRTIKRSAKNKLNGCKNWDNDESVYQDCNEKGQKQQDAVIQWAESQCANKKQYKDAKKKYGSKFINWSKSQAQKYSKLQKDSYKELGPAVLVEGGGKGLSYPSASAYAPMQLALSVKF
jgi:hypothetical protein